MAGKVSGFLNTLPAGPKGNVGDFQHAARIFVDDNFRLAPRYKFLYYLYVEIDPSAHGASVFTATRADKEVSLLVKRAELPKFNFETTVKNQYNRKKIVYKQMTYQPITLSFHDDNQGIMNALYALYYSYYARDYHNKVSDYSLGNRELSARYGMDSPPELTVSLFRRVSLFTLSKQRFNEYKFLGPRITQWSHGDLDYGAGGETVESSMTIDYEGINYGSGEVTYGVPDGFASLAYDTIPSPLTTAGGGIRGAAGAAGGDILEGIESIFGSMTKNNLLDRPGQFLTPAVQTLNTYQAYNDSGTSSQANKLSSGSVSPPAANLIGGIAGASFPKDASATMSQTTATAKVLNQQQNSGSFQETFKGTGGRAPSKGDF